MEKTYEELSISDDFMFYKIMTTHLDLCKKLLELILEKKIVRISLPEGQKVIDLTADGKGIRLDVFTEEDDGTTYDIEMQISNTKEIPKRTRYYQGMIDLNTIEKGKRYRELRKSYVIFICLFDLFECEQYVYTFENRCTEVPGLKLDDGAYKVILNVDGTKGNVSDELKDFLALIRGKIPQNSGFALEVQKQVEHAREHEEWRLEYMTLLERDHENQEIGKKIGEGIGKKIGKQIGIDEERIRNIILALESEYGEEGARVMLKASDEEIAEARKRMQH